MENLFDRDFGVPWFQALASSGRVEFVPFLLLHAFHFSSHPGFKSLLENEDGSTSCLTKFVQSLAPVQVAPIAELKVPGVVEMITLLKQHGDGALQNDSPLRKELDQYRLSITSFLSDANVPPSADGSRPNLIHFQAATIAMCTRDLEPIASLPQQILNAWSPDLVERVVGELWPHYSNAASLLASTYLSVRRSDL